MAVKRWCAAATLVLLMPGTTRAVTEANFGAATTGDLVELCDARPDGAMGSAAINFCHGFAQGAVSVEMQNMAASHAPKLFCMPTPPPTRADTLSGFVKWARASQDHMGEPAADGLFRFLRDRFPCPKSR